jgi:hypothetical protein
LTSKLGKYLREAEHRYGQRDLEWTILGIEFYGKTPHVWYPDNEKLISIILTEAAALDPNEALFQLAHEVVHLLTPVRATPTNVFEEGLATLFAHEMSARDQLGKSSGQASYLAAEKTLKEFLAAYPNGIQQVRQTKKPFFDLTDGDILGACPNVSSALAKTLTEKFAR